MDTLTTDGVTLKDIDFVYFVLFCFMKVSIAHVSLLYIQRAYDKW